MGLHDLSCAQLIELAAQNGFGGLDVPADALHSRETARAARQAITDAGMQWGLFWLPCDITAEDDAQYARGLERLNALLPLVATTGCARTYAHIWPGSNARDYAENFQWHVARLSPAAALLAEYGVTLGLEFIGPKTLRDTFRYPFIHTLDGIVELADACTPPVGVVLAALLFCARVVSVLVRFRWSPQPSQPGRTNPDS